VQGYTVPQLLWARNVFHMVAMLAFLPRMGLRRVVGANQPGLQVVRGVVILVAAIAFITALRYVPLADAYALSFLAPLLVVVLSIPILGERVDRRRWAAVGVGFIGVVVIVRPGLGVTHPAALLVLVMALTFALYQVMTRMMAASESPVSLLFYPTLVGTLATSLVVPFFWVPVAPWHWPLLIMLGMVGAVGHGLLIRGLRLAPASLAAPFTYFQILFGTFYGYLVFDDLPDLPTVLGGMIIVASGLYVFAQDAMRAPGPASSQPSARD
jgi:drug/metabolite transporter (DMT)-like permease